MPNDDLDVSVTDIQQNFLTANTVMDIDHYPFDNVTANKGYHKQSTYPAGADPLTVAGTSKVYGKSYTPDYTGATADTQLFAISGLGGISQLTGNSGETDGWQWVGGVLIQWGIVPPPVPIAGTFLSGNAFGTVTFKDRGPLNAGIPFPTVCFAVVATPTYLLAPQAFKSGTVSIAAPLSPTSFDWSLAGDQTFFTGFTWIAIGR